MSKKYNELTGLFIIMLVLMLMYIIIQLNVDILGYVLPARLKKTAVILIVGAAIGVSSLVFQTLTENHLLTPSVIGLDAVYLFIQTVLIFIFGAFNTLLFNTYINFFLSVGLMVLFTSGLFKLVFKKDVNVYFILLFGLVMGTCFQSLSSFIHIVMNPDDFLLLQDKMFASFNAVNESLLFICYIVITVMLLLIYRKRHELDVLSLGRVHAVNLGIDVDRLTKSMLLIVAVLVSISTALVGPITFLGIIVCNVTYQVMRTYEHRLLILAVILMSAITLLVGQMLTQYLFDGNTEITIMINFIGGLYFIILLFKEDVHDYH